MTARKGTTAPEDTAKKTEAKTAETARKKTENKEYKHFVYIGPSLPGGKLKSNTVLYGGIEKIKVYYKDMLEKYPQAVRLIVPVEKLGELKEKAQTPGNIINKYYGDIVSAMNSNKEE